MKRLLLPLCTLLCLSQLVLAQKSTLTGRIRDTLDQVPLEHTSISLLRAGDSSLYKYTRSNVSGAFEFSDVDTGNYIVMILHPRFVDYVDQVRIKEAGTVDLGTVKLSLEAKLLEDVTVRAQIPAMRRKGDTMEYRADSFHLRPDATVEDLLQRLPGIQVDKNGKITAQGQKVDKVLLDGDEFFGNDPTIVTRNMQADAIDKVQVYDRKSDKANFTGIDDGQRLRTINLKMKEDRKRGFFGKLELGAGTNDRWNNRGMLNSFQARRKISAYGLMSSTGKTGLDFSEVGSFGDGDILSAMSLGAGSFTGEGIPKTWSAGLNYSNHFGDNKASLTGSYRFYKENTESEGDVFSQSVLPDTVFYNTQRSNGFTSKQRNSVNGTFDAVPDSLDQINLNVQGGRSVSSGFSNFSSQAVNGSNMLINQNIRSSTSNGTSQDMDLRMMFRRKFSKVGRSLDFIGEYKPEQSDGSGNLRSKASFYDNIGAVVSVDTIDQLKVNRQRSGTFSGNLSYSEPLFKNTFLQLDYALNYQNNNSSKLSYNKDASGKFVSLDSLNSSNYLYRTLTQTGMVALAYTTKDLIASIGTSLSSSTYRQQDHLLDTSGRYTYHNFFPTANLHYQFLQGHTLDFNYTGQTQAPSLTQIQPVHDNSNPLMVYVGNPNLKQQFSQNFLLGYSHFDALSMSGLDARVSLSTTSNAFTTNNFTDAFGRTVNQYTNVNGNYSLSFEGAYNFSLTHPHTFIRTGLVENISKNNNYVNGLPNTTMTYKHGANIGAFMAQTKRLSISLDVAANYNTTSSSIQAALSNHYWVQTDRITGEFEVLAKWTINTDVSYNFQQKINAFDKNTSFTTWNAFVGRRLFKSDKGLIKLSCQDILDQNKGYSRSITNNVLTENSYRQIGRYMLLSFVWNFSYSPALPPADAK